MSLIPISSHLYAALQELAQQKRMIFISGLPGVGKSLLIQQLALIAHEHGRHIHLLQWITARTPFETPENLRRYPENEGVTHPVIRKAVGLWARPALHAWHEAHPEPEHLLIGELPLIGSRLIELAQPQNDPAETLLRDEQTAFVVPVPSWEVREVIEKARARTLADPQHEQEKMDAAPNVLRALWEEVNGIARMMGLTKANPQTKYNPYIYGGVYQALLQHRHAQLLLIDQVLRPTQSVYELDVVASELQAAPAEVAQQLNNVQSRFTTTELQAAVAGWHALATEDPQSADPGPELRLPLPQTLPTAVADTGLTTPQRQALQKLLALPVDTPPDALLPALDAALAEFQPETALETAGVHKFDVYDSYFNVTRTTERSGEVYIAGLLQSFRNVIANLNTPPFNLTVVELPLLRIAVETSLRQFNLE